MTEKPGKDNIRKKKSLIAKIYRQKTKQKYYQNNNSNNKKKQKKHKIEDCRTAKSLECRDPHAAPHIPTLSEPTAATEMKQMLFFVETDIGRGKEEIFHL